MRRDAINTALLMAQLPTVDWERLEASRKKLEAFATHTKTIGSGNKDDLCTLVELLGSADDAQREAACALDDLKNTVGELVERLNDESLRDIARRFVAGERFDDITPSLQTEIRGMVR